MSAKEKAAELRLRANRALAVADSTKRSEVAMQELNDFGRNDLGAQLGMLLRKKGLKVSDLANKWGGKDGEIDKKEVS